MNKVKKIIVSTIITLSVLLTVAGISVLATKALSLTENPETYFETHRGNSVILGCYTNWTATSTSASDHQTSFKYASCQSYTYINSQYQSQSHKANTGTSATVITDNATVDGRTQRTEFIGFVNNNAAIGSGTYGQLTVIVNRTKK